MGKKIKPKGKQHFDSYELSLKQKAFLYKKFKESKSIDEVRNDFIKVFKWSYVPSERFIHKLFVLFQKKQFKKKAHKQSPKANNKKNNTILEKNRNKAIANCCSSEFSNTGNSINLGRQIYERTTIDHTSQTNENSKQVENTISTNKMTELDASDSVIIIEPSNESLTSKDVRIENSIPSNNNSLMTSNSIRNVKRRGRRKKIKKKKLKNVGKTIEKRKNFNKTLLKNIVSTTNLVNRKNDKENNNIKQNNLLLNSSNFPPLPEPSRSFTKTIQYPVSSTPFKRFGTKNKKQNISMSPIVANQRQREHFNKLEKIVEISDDEESRNQFLILDQTGSSPVKNDDDIVTIDAVGCGDLENTSRATEIRRDTLDLKPNANDFASSVTNIDLTVSDESFSTAVKKNIGIQEKVEACYDLTADDTIVPGCGASCEDDLPGSSSKSFFRDFYEPSLVKKSSNGSNIYNPCKVQRKGLRMIVIDGSNVAMSKSKQFSVERLKICIDYFLVRGHEVKAFVPRFRCKMGKSSNPQLLMQLENAGHVVFTPSREVGGHLITSYDDRYIVQCAAEYGGVIVSGDNYRDLLGENPSWKKTIEERLLIFTWVGDLLMFPQDPLGRRGPDLKTFLSHPKT